MKTLYLAWQDKARSRAWFPIGRLDAEVKKPKFRFVYTGGALRAQQEAGLEPLDSFPDFNKVYESEDLFPLFKNRVLDPGRQDFRQYLAQLGLSPDTTDPIEILTVSGGERQTDSLEVFPKFERRRDSGFRCRFFLHGWRHVNEAAQERLMQMKPGEALRVAVELNNPVTQLALQLESSDDYHMVGWAPRYLVYDLIHAISAAQDEIAAKVIKVNPAPAPAKQRVLIELTGRWPKDYKPMSAPDFQPVVVH